MTKDAILGGQYRLEEVLGEGATGKVFRAVHLGPKRPYAFKALKGKAGRGSRALARDQEPETGVRESRA